MSGVSEFVQQSEQDFRQESNTMLERQSSLCSLVQVSAEFGLRTADEVYRDWLDLKENTVTQRLLRRGVLIMLLLLVAAIVPLLFGLTYLGIALLLVTLAALQMFVRVFWIATDIKLINPFVLPYTAVLTLLLAILSFGIQIYLLTIPTP